jgi:photosystem II stability/assembly factor-like uncharacterized protein
MHSIGSLLGGTSIAALRRALQVACCFGAVLGPAGSAGAVLWNSYGPTGGNVRALAADPTSPTTFYAAGGGFFRTVDAGASWTAINSGVPDVASFVMTGLTVDPLNPANVYASGYAGATGGVFESTNGGESWTFSSLGPRNDVVAAGDPLLPGTVYSVGGPILRSLDAGASWTQVQAGNFISVAVAPSAPKTVYAGGAVAGMVKSTNGGATWTSTGTLASNSVRAIAVHPTQPGTVYAGLDHFGVYKTTNGGDTWTSIGPIVRVPSVDVYELAIDPSNPNTVYAAILSTTGFGVYKTTDGGANWASTPLATNGYALALSPSAPNRLVAGTTLGAWRTGDGAASWNEANVGMPNTAIRSIASATPPGPIFAGATSGKVYRSDDGGLSWLPNPAVVSDDQISALAVDPTNPAIVYAGTFGTRGIHKSSDGGATWSPLSTGSPAPLNGYALVVDPTNPAIVYAAGFGGVFRSTQGGNNWVHVNSGGHPLPVALVLDPANPSTLYAGADPGTATNFPGVFKTTNGGGLWSAVNTGLPSVGGTGVQALALDPASGAVYVGLENLGVHKTINGGASWTPASTGLTNLDVTSLRVDPGSPSTVYAGTRIAGVSRSVDGGATWSAQSDGLYNRYVFALGAAGPGRPLVASGGNGVFVLAVCADGLDNDGDGLTDHPADPGCASASSDLENPACDDDLDNEGDGTMDWNGGPGGVPADPHCTRASRRRETACGLGFELALVLPPLALWRRARRRRANRPSRE